MAIALPLIAGATLLGAGTGAGLLISKKTGSAGSSADETRKTSALIEVGTKKDLSNRNYTYSPVNTDSRSYQTTSTYNPTLTYNPIIIEGSPYASATGASVSPSNYITPTLTPTTSVTPNISTGGREVGGGSGGVLDSLTDNISTLAIIGGLGIGAYLLLKPKKKKGGK